jgi:hypothetical protein
MVMPRSIKANCYGSAVTLDPPFAGDVAVILTIGDKRYCMSFGGSSWRNDERRTHRREAPAPDACAAAGGGGTTSTTVGGGTTSSTIGGGTTSTTVGGGTTSTTIGGGTTSTTVVGQTTSTTVAGGTTSTTVVGETTSTTVAGGTTSTTVVGGTTSTTIGGGGGCCNGAGFIRVTTKDAAGDCGDLLDAGGAKVTDLACSGLYTGGGGNSVPLPFAVPDQGRAVSAITSCTGQSATLGGTTSADTGSNRNCTGAGCLFGAPLAVPNPGSTPTSVCVLNAASAPASGSVQCDTGASDVTLPLTSVIHLTGDTATDPGATITGIQPCPLCSGGNPGTCIGGPNNGMACTPETSELNAAYPTSHDCPPDPMFSIGSLPIAFVLTTGTVTWTGTNPTNDTGSTVANQNRVFSGFCRDQDGSGAFEGSSAATAHECWKNGVSVGAPCADPFESCLQKNNGAFGPSGGNNRTIVAIGSSASLLGGPSDGHLVSIFTVPPTFDPTIDAAGDLPGPGAVSLPATAELCSTGTTCP